MSAERMSTDELIAAWDAKLPNYQTHTKTRSIGPFQLYYNPTRAEYLKSSSNGTLADKEIKNPEDIFCERWQAIVEKQILGQIILTEHPWILMVNSFPVEQYHSLLILEEHKDQVLSPEILKDFVEFSVLYPTCSLGFNSWGAGASQNHIHTHIFIPPLPITNWKREVVKLVDGMVVSQPLEYPAVCLIFSPETNTQLAYSSKILAELEEKKTPFNCLFVAGEIYLLPRKMERDTHSTKRGVDTAFAKIPIVDQSQFENFTADDLAQLYQEIGHQQITLEGTTYES